MGMAITSLDTHEIVKDLKSAGFTDEQAEAVTRAVKQAQEIDLSGLATKQDTAELKTELNELRVSTRADLAELRAELIKWVVGVGFAQVAMILAVLRLFPGTHP
jgi:hypothetical protein